MKYLIVFFFLIGCVQFQVAPGVYSESLELHKYANIYLEYKGEYLGINEVEYPIILEFGELPFPVVGRCRLAEDRSYSVRQVTFDEEFWESIDEGRRVNLFLHEMGHCDLNLEHQEKYLGIMNSSESIYLLKEEYVENMFLRGL